MPRKFNIKKVENPEEIWRDWFSTDAYSIDKQLRRLFRILPHDPRCKFCFAPFDGVGAALVKIAFKKERSALNPRFCNMCDAASRKFPGGSEVEMSMLFVDVRGSTAISEKMTPIQFSQWIDLFYSEATRLISEKDGLVDKLAGDSVAAFWGSGFAGPDYVRRTITSAQEISSAMKKLNIPVGISVHAGNAYFGAIGKANGLTDITALGEEVNTAARIAAQAGAGEILISEQALEKAGMDPEALEGRQLILKGISDPVRVRIFR
jgi:adenylate cyclase